MLAERLLHELAAVVVTKHFGNVVGLEQSCQKFLKRLMLRCQSVISSFGQDVFASIGEGHLHHENPALRFACEIFRKSSGAFWPKHNLISMRSNHTRETSHFITLYLACRVQRQRRMLHRSSFLSSPRTLKCHRHTYAACSHITRPPRSPNHRAYAETKAAVRPKKVGARGQRLHPPTALWCGPFFVPSFG